jgi:4-azaleucine resistance transporter AzlC
LVDSLAIAVPIAAFGTVYGLAARDAGLSVVETASFSLLPFAGASQFAAVGYLDEGLRWVSIVALTALLNARHLLYSAALAPELGSVSRLRRAAMAQFLTDEAFALTTNHVRRLGRADRLGYWIAALVGVYIPWNLGTLVGALAGGAIPDPAVLGLDVVFPASMAALAVGLITERRELVAAVAGASVAVPAALLLGTGAGVMVGGLVGPLVAMAVLRVGDGDAEVPAGGRDQVP